MFLFPSRVRAARSLTFHLLTLFALAGGATAQMTTDRIAMGMGGAQPNGNVSDVAMSADGRFVVFSSDATNLVAGDTNGKQDVFLYDADLQSVERISVTSLGVEGNNNSFSPSISDDGTLVVFVSTATNFAGDDDNNALDVFLYDRLTTNLTLISRHSDTTLGDNASYDCKISGNGLFVVYRSLATNLVDEDTNGFVDIFLYDVQNATTSRVSVSTDDVQANGDSLQPSISADGTVIAFASAATNLSGLDTNFYVDVFVRDNNLSTTTIASRTYQSGSPNGPCTEPCISRDGAFVVFKSTATNMVLGDINGMSDIFKYNLSNGDVDRVSVNSSNVQGNGDSRTPSISEDGRFVSFLSSATNIAPFDTNGVMDLFVRDTELNLTYRIDLSTLGSQANAAMIQFAMSADSTAFAYCTNASTLADGDSNAAADVFRTTTDLQTEAMTSLDPINFRGTVVDATKVDMDRADLSGAFKFNNFTPDAKFNPVADNFTISFGNSADPMIFTIAANDGAWKTLPKQRYSWKTAKNVKPAVVLTLDIPKGKFTFKMAKAEFGDGQMQQTCQFQLFLGSEMFSFEDEWSVKSNAASSTYKYHNIFE